MEKWATNTDWDKWFRENDFATWLNMTCIYCGSGEGNSTDHVIPRAQGGTNDPQNLVPACFSCNTSKGAQTPEEWRCIDSAEIYEGSPRHWDFIVANGFRGRRPR